MDGVNHGSVRSEHTRCVPDIACLPPPPPPKKKMDLPPQNRDRHLHHHYVPRGPGATRGPCGPTRRPRPARSSPAVAAAARLLVHALIESG